MTTPPTHNQDPATTASLAIVLPLYQDAANVDALRTRLPAVLDELNLTWEIICVDDASPGLNTWRTIQAWAAADPRIKGLRLMHNLNSQGAILVGLQHVSAAAAVIMDSDLQDPPEAIPQLVAAWQLGHDVVHAVYQKRRGNIFSRLLRRLFYGILSLCHGRWYPPAGNFCLLGSSALKAAQDLADIPFWRTWRQRLGGKHTNVFITREKRLTGKSHQNFFLNLRWAGYALLCGPNLLPEYFLVGGSLIIGSITFFHPGVWPVMLLAEFFLLMQYLILRYLAAIWERPHRPWPIAEKINLPNP